MQLGHFKFREFVLKCFMHSPSSQISQHIHHPSCIRWHEERNCGISNFNCVNAVVVHLLNDGAFHGVFYHERKFRTLDDDWRLARWQSFRKAKKSIPNAVSCSIVIESAANAVEIRIDWNAISTDCYHLHFTWRAFYPRVNNMSKHGAWAQ